MRHKDPSAVTVPEAAKSVVNVTTRLDILQSREKPALIDHYMNVSIEFAALTIQLETANGNETNIIALASHKSLPTLAKCDIVKVMRNNPMVGKLIFFIWWLTSSDIKYLQLRERDEHYRLGLAQEPANPGQVWHCQGHEE